MVDNDIKQQKQLLHDRGICVIIPTFNNVGTIADVVNRALAQCSDIIVVNDGSTDGTQDVVKQLATSGGKGESCTIVSYDKNAGKGTALKRGFRRALSMGFAYAITLDADGQHYPEDIPLMLEANMKHPGCLIVGQRKGLETMERSGGSKFANAFSNFWFMVQTGCRLKDTQTGYRLYPLKKLRGLSLLTSRYEAELELMVFASWHGVKLVSTPVNVFYPPREERVSHFRPGLDFTRISILNTVLCVLALVYGLPLNIIRRVLDFLRNLYSLVFFVVVMLFILNPIAMIYLKCGKITQQKRDRLHVLLQTFSKFIILWHKIPGCPFTIGNPHSEDFSKPAVIISNHQSHLDLMTMLIHTPKLVVLTNDWVWKNPFYGYVIRNAEYYPVSEGWEKMLPKLKSLVERGYSIAVYPEGTRSADCSIQRFHQGAFLIADELGLDILPMVLYGAGKALPKKEMWLHKWPIRIEIDKRISPDELRGMGKTLKARASLMRKYYKRRYQEVANRVES